MTAVVVPVNITWLPGYGVEAETTDPYFVTVATVVDDMFRSERFEIKPLSETLTVVNSTQFDEHGFVLCLTCRARAGSESCCGDTRSYDEVISYMAQYHRVFGKKQRSPKQIVRDTPVNVVAGLVTR